MAVTAAQLIANVQVQGADQAKTQLNSVGSSVSEAQEKSTGFMGSISQMGSRFLSMGSQLGMTIFGLQNLGQMAVSVAQAFLAPNASMEQTKVAFTQLLGSSSAADAELKKLADFAANTPFEFPEIADATQKLLAFQFPLKSTQPLLTAIGDALSGLGKNTPASLEQVVDVFGQMNAAGKIQTQDLMQLTSVGINGFQLLANGMHLTVAQVKDMVTNGTIPASKGIELLREGMEKTFGGGMQAQSRTFNGLLSTFQDNISAAWRAFTGPLFEEAKNGLTTLGNLVSSPSFQQFATTLGTVVGGALATLATNSQVLIPVLAGLGAIVAGLLVPAVASLAVSVVTATWPFLAIGVAVAALTAGFMALYQNNAGFKNFIDAVVTGITQAWNVIQANFIPVLQQVGDVIQSQVMPILQDIAAWLVSTFQPVWQQLIDVWNSQLLPAFQLIISSAQPLMPLFQAIAEIIGAVVIVALGLLIGIITGVIQAFSNLISAVVRIIGGIAQIIAGGVAIIEGIFALFTDLLTGNFSNLGNDLSHIMQGIMTMFSGGWNVIAGIFSGAWGVISGLVSGFVTGIIGFFTHLWDMLVGHSIIPDMINAIVQWFANLPGWVIAHVVALVTGLIAQFSSMQARAVALAQQLINNVVSFFASLPGSVISHLAALVAGAASQFSSMQATAVSIVQGLVNNVVSFFSTLPGRAVSAISSLGGMLQGQLSSIAGRAASWGSEIIGNLISGIQGQLGALGNVVGNVAGKIASMLHFSKPDTGPLADIDTWIPDMTSILETGFRDQASRLGQAASSVASKIAAPLASASTPSGLTPGAALPYQLPALASNTPVQVVVQGPPVYLDGRVMANGLMPHITNAIRYNVGTHSF